MDFIGISVNHNTAPIGIRESLHLSDVEATELIRALKDTVLKEGVVISTCNRTEIFGFPYNESTNADDLKAELIKFKPVEGISGDNFVPFFSCSAVKHLFKVAAGIDSLVLGDSQILGQVKRSFQLSEENSFSGSVLRRVADAALRTGKRSIQETGIGEGAVSVSFAAIQVIEKVFSNLEEKSAMIIGAGETAELAAIHLKDKGVKQIAITNRTFQRGADLAAKVDGIAYPFNQFKSHLHDYDIVVSATSADDIIIGYQDINEMMRKRRGKPVCLADIAMPRDIDPSVKSIDNVFYQDIDSLKGIVEHNLNKRELELPKVNDIILDEMTNFFGWYNTLEVVPTIKMLRDFFEVIRTDELAKIKNKVAEEDFHKLEDMTRRLVGRLLHNPTLNLREAAESGGNHQDVTIKTLFLKELFGLNDNKNRK